MLRRKHARQGRHERRREGQRGRHGETEVRPGPCPASTCVNVCTGAPADETTTAYRCPFGLLTGFRCSAKATILGVESKARHTSSAPSSADSVGVGPGPGPGRALLERLLIARIPRARDLAHPPTPTASTPNLPHGACCQATGVGGVGAWSGWCSTEYRGGRLVMGGGEEGGWCGGPAEGLEGHSQTQSIWLSSWVVPAWSRCCQACQAC